MNNQIKLTLAVNKLAWLCLNGSDGRMLGRADRGEHPHPTDPHTLTHPSTSHCNQQRNLLLCVTSEFWQGILGCLQSVSRTSPKGSVCSVSISHVSFLLGSRSLIQGQGLPNSHFPSLPEHSLTLSASVRGPSSLHRLHSSVRENGPGEHRNNTVMDEGGCCNYMRTNR
ncbi:hypothetical protein INR49_030559 [Caranx melampygus]|nr:hypothetical protein INR49_030559 [Caranx melampygus]